MVTVNKDTGQKLVSTPNQTPENGSTTPPVVVLGTNKLVDSGMTQAQLFLFNSLVNKYVSTLKIKYTQVAILNGGYVSKPNKIVAKMRLGQDSGLLNIEVDFNNLVNVRFLISSGQNSKQYDSGWQTAGS